MQKTSKRILVSILTLVLAVVAIGTTTFAWFTLGNIGTLGNIEGSITSGEGLQIKMITRNSDEPGQDNDQNIIKQTEFLNHLVFDKDTFLQNGFKFTGVEYHNLTELEELKTMMKLGVTSNGHYYRGAETEINKDYIEIELIFRSLQEDAEVLLSKVDTKNSLSKKVKSGNTFTGLRGSGFLNEDNADYYQDQQDDYLKVLEGNKYQVEGHNALRVGLVKFKEVNQELVEDTMDVYYNGHNEDNNRGQSSFIASGGYKIFEDSESNEQANVNYLTHLKNNGDVTSLFPGEYLKLNGETVVDQGDLDETDFAKSILITTLSEQEVKDDDLDPEEDLMHYFIGKATIRIWVDGWDPHAFDAIFEQLLTIDLQFELKK